MFMTSKFLFTSLFCLFLPDCIASSDLNHKNRKSAKDISSVVQKAIAHTSNAGGIHYSQVSANKKDLLAKIGASTVPSILVYQKGNLVERLDSLNPENLEYRLGKIAWLYNT
eukprot:TRINITY_DN3780_c0_g1_i2.p1 TRINITY_DN3780_c0_g1~~TRINITY_DN3780_c0_g1_i2.p1  ORF type:complete len:112 (+),score=17.52 TRINITY_DN3780_c0_g1_i2:285-620(+)